jgi:hypothetical protein
LAELALAEGRAADALDITRRLESARPPDTHPVWAPWRSLRARALAQLSQPADARWLALEDLELARRVGAPWVIGRGLRILAEIDGPDRVPLAHEAVARLEETSARLELAKAHQALGDALLAAGDEAGACAAWTAAAQQAHDCGAAGLAGAANRLVRGAPAKS